MYSFSRRSQAGRLTLNIEGDIATAAKRAPKGPSGTFSQNGGRAQNWFEHFVCGSNAALYEPFGEV